MPGTVKSKRGRLPPEFKQRLSLNPARQRVGATLERLGLDTVCRSAGCPNCNRCYSEGTATFLIMGPDCTRRCAFCAVPKGRPARLDPGEPEAVARAVLELDLCYAVVTSVTRDDLPDGGAGHFARTVAAIRRARPGTPVEILIPDFNGDERALRTVADSEPEVLNHNMETVPRLYPAVRPQADYRRSLKVLAMSRQAGLATKSGLMVGLGESPEEVRLLLDDLAGAGCGAVTVGQYLAPSPNHRPIERFWSRDEFLDLGEYGRERLGLLVSAGPLVRSSYGAAELFRSMKKTPKEANKRQQRRA